MSYAAAVDHLYALGQELAPATNQAPRRKFDLAHMRTLAAALGDPQKRFAAVLIAGTNGKGSTSATLASILTAAGYRTALYTSPHLSRVNERIQIDGHEIPDEEFARLYFFVDEVARTLVESGELPYPPSFFEVLTAVAFLHFAGMGPDDDEKAPVDIAVLEVGLGGRLDATNIVDPIISILTDIALDHQEYLGNTIAEITREKAGILRDHGTLVTLPQHPEANQAIGEAAASLDLRAISAAGFLPPQTRAASEAPQFLPRNRYTLMVDGEPLTVDSPLSGHHQQRNIALAIAAALELRNHRGYKYSQDGLISNEEGYKMPIAALENGIRHTRWPGRLELLSPEGSPQVLLDVAHNPAGAWTLRAALAQMPPERPRTLIFSCLRDKNLAEMAQILFPLFDAGSSDRPHDHIVLAPIDNPRAASVHDLLAAAHSLEIPAHAAPHLAGALAQARSVTPPDGLIVATGSVYLVGEIRHLVVQP